jgi:hypothetical protein
MSRRLAVVRRGPKRHPLLARSGPRDSAKRWIKSGVLESPGSWGVLCWVAGELCCIMELEGPPGVVEAVWVVKVDVLAGRTVLVVDVELGVK